MGLRFLSTLPTKRMAKKLSPEEEAQLLSAACMTWRLVADQEITEALSIKDATEIVLSERIVSIGKLPALLYDKIMSAGTEAEDCLLKHPRSWF